METLFLISNLLVMPFWGLMIFLPRWRGTERIMASLWPVAVTALLYTVLVLPNVPALLPALSNPDLATIAALLGAPAGATVAWVHFLAFDLFVGRWVYWDGRRTGLRAWVTSLILFFVLMVGPLGLVLYLAARSLKTHTVSLVTEA
ncbi:MAG: ABA4-like family protein [Caldilinea sp.]|uniref:ABA4-like family protein n=1 Tax=Caldilinea sp. TaxID=2293560 RepID=UPI002C68E42E|nr:DUF4281 domain-containing protein [Anaerolineales bacterium]HQY91247.1 ABA4-like family protein [Caldilinea sp.]